MNLIDVFEHELHVVYKELHFGQMLVIATVLMVAKEVFECAMGRITKAKDD